MAQSAHSTGDEHLDSLIRMAPIAFEGGAYVLRALCMLTALLLSSSDLGLKCGLSTTLIQKFAEVKATRSSGGDLATVNLDEILQFYKDVIKTYQLHVGRIKSLVSFNNMAKYTNVTGVHGVNDNSFHRLHSVLLALSFNCIPLEWGVGAMFEPASAFGLESKYRTNEYSYLKLFRKEYASFVANLLGPKPTLGACLTLLTPRVLLDEAELISLRVFRRAVDGAICILSLGDSNYDSGVPVFQLLTFRDSLATRCASDYNSFDRMGFSEVHAPHLDYFRQAMESLASFEVDNYDHQEPIVVEQEYVELDCTVDNLDELDVVEGLRNSETKAYTDCVSSDVKTDIRMKALCNAMREYNVSVSKLRSDTVKVCADSDYRKRLKDDKDIWASQCNEIMRLNRDADLWLNTVFKLAKDFRVLKVCKRPEWLQKNVQDFAADCFGFPIK